MRVFVAHRGDQGCHPTTMRREYKAAQCVRSLAACAIRTLADACSVVPVQHRSNPRMRGHSCTHEQIVLPRVVPMTRRWSFRWPRLQDDGRRFLSGAIQVESVSTNINEMSRRIGRRCLRQVRRNYAKKNQQQRINTLQDEPLETTQWIRCWLNGSGDNSCNGSWREDFRQPQSFTDSRSDQKSSSRR
jgi:hypothetical protein